MKKKILALILSAVMLVTYMPVGIFASAETDAAKSESLYTYAENENIGFTFYALGNYFNYDGDGDGKKTSSQEQLDELKAVLEAGYVNQIFTGLGETRTEKADYAASLEHFKKVVELCAEYNCKFWYMPGKWVPEGETLGGNDGYLDHRISDAVNFIKEAGAWDLFLGFHWDEPILQGMTNSEFLQMTEYLSVLYKKRIYPVFSYQVFSKELREFANNNDSGKEVLTSEALKYVTDAGWDLYAYDIRESAKSNSAQNAKIQEYAKLVGRNITTADEFIRDIHDIFINKFDHPVNVWMYPATYNVGPWTYVPVDEDYCVAQVEYFYNLLNETTAKYENQISGGLACFTYGSDKFVGLSKRLLISVNGNELYPSETKWPTLDSKIKEVAGKCTAIADNKIFTGYKNPISSGLNDTASYAVMVPRTTTNVLAAGYLQYTSGNQSLNLRHENDEHFYVLNNALLDGRTNTNVQLNVKNMFYLGHADDANLDAASINAFAIRIKFNDKNAGTTVPAKFKLYFNNPDNSNHIRKQVLSKDDTNCPLWLDLNDGSLTKMYAESGYSNPNHYEVMGNMDGYMIIPFAYFGTDAEALKTDLNIVQFQMLKNDETVNSTTGAVTAKASSWENRELLIGDMFYVEDVNTFASARTSDIAKYSSGNDDGAYYAQKIPGYKSSFGGNSTMYASKTYSKTKYSTTTAFNGDAGYVHISTLAGGDRALEIVPNNENTVNIEAFNYDTYDSKNDDATFAKALSGVPEEITGIKGLAVRVSITGNENKTSTFYPALSYGDTSIQKNYFKLNVAEKEIPFIDYKTGNITTYTTTASGIPVTGNIDGYFVIPALSREYWSGLASDSIKTFRGVGTVLSGGNWYEGQKFYLGDSFWLTDVEKFTEYHSKAALKLYGASLTLENSLTINFKADKATIDAAGLTAPYATVRFGSSVTSIKGVADNEGKYYVFSFKNIAPHKIGDKVKVTLSATKDGKKVVANEAFEYSVADYCNRKIEEYHKATDDTAVAFRALLTDLLNYGKAAQIYAEYKTNSFANINANQKFASANIPELSTQNKDGSFIVNESAAANWSAVSLYLQENITMKFKFTTSLNVKDLKVAVSLAEPADQTLPADATIIKAFKFEGNNKYCVEFSGLYADELRVPVYVTIYDADDNAVSNTLKYSVEAYAASKSNYSIVDEEAKIDNTDISMLAVEMMKYSDSAKAFAAMQ